MEDFKWEDTPEKTALFESVFSDDEKYEQLKFMVKGGAPYMYPENGYETGRETVVEKCFRQLDYDFFMDLNAIHLNNPDLDEEIDDNWHEHLGHAMEAAAEINDNHTADLLVGENATGANPFVIAGRGGWRFLGGCSDLDLTDSDGNTILHHAAREGRTSTIKYILEQKYVSPNSTNSEGQTALHLAGKFHPENDSAIAVLIENSDTNIRDSEGVSITQLMAEQGKYQFISRLIELGADPDAHDDKGHFSFIESAKNGQTITVKKLVREGATVALEDSDSKSALDHALINKRDSTSAMLIRIDRRDNYLNYYEQRYENTNNNIEKLIKARQRETLVALLDRSLSVATVGESDQRPTLDLEVWQKGKILERLARWGDEELAYHGTIRILVDAKFWKFGFRMLFLKMVLYLLFLLSLSYSLVQASTAGVARDSYTDGAWNVVRIVSDLFVLLYFFYNLATEGTEIVRIMRNTREYLLSKRAERSKAGDKSYDRLNGKSREKPPSSLKSRLYNIFCVRVAVDYFSDLSNVFDTLALLSLLLLIILRVARQPVQWVFAPLTFLLNAARIFKFIVLIPRLGPYATIIYRILVKDVPLFSSLFLVSVCIFTGCYFLALRTPYSAQGFYNASLAQETVRTAGLDDRVQWVFLSGVRVLLEGSVYETNYLYRHLNWMAASIYLAFLFLTVVVFLNVFIAQLSDRYAAVKEKANQLFALQKLRFLVQTETTSVLSAVVDFKQKYKLGPKRVSPGEMLDYYSSSDPVSLNEAAIDSIKEHKQFSQIPTFKVKAPNNEQSAEFELYTTLAESRERVDEILHCTNSSVGEVVNLESMIDGFGETILSKLDTIERKLSSL